MNKPKLTPRKNTIKFMTFGVKSKIRKKKVKFVKTKNARRRFEPVKPPVSHSDLTLYLLSYRRLVEINPNVCVYMLARMVV